MVGSSTTSVHVKQHVGVGERFLREFEHAFLELVLGLEHAWSVGKHDLVFRGVDYAHDAVTRGLRLRCDYAHAFADEIIHQRRLAYVGIAYYVDETRFVFGCHVGMLVLMVMCRSLKQKIAP